MADCDNELADVPHCTVDPIGELVAQATCISDGLVRKFRNTCNPFMGTHVAADRPDDGSFRFACTASIDAPPTPERGSVWYYVGGQIPVDQMSGLLCQSHVSYLLDFAKLGNREQVSLSPRLMRRGKPHNRRKCNGAHPCTGRRVAVCPLFASARTSTSGRIMQLKGLSNPLKLPRCCMLLIQSHFDPNLAGASPSCSSGEVDPCALASTRTSECTRRVKPNDYTECSWKGLSPSTSSRISA